jgi:hypothetical protein
MPHKYDLKMDHLMQPFHPYTGHASTIGFKIMKVFNDHTKLHKHKKYLGFLQLNDPFYSGGTSTPGLPRPDSEPNALKYILDSDNPAIEGAKKYSLLEHAMYRSNQVREGEKLRVKLYIKNSAFPPCTDPTTRPGLTCDTYLPQVLDKLRAQFPNTEFRMKVQNPTVWRNVFDPEMGIPQCKKISTAATVRYGYNPTVDGRNRKHKDLST